MSTEIERESFLRNLVLVRPAVANQAYIAALTHFFFDGVSVTAYNDVAAISVRTSLDLVLCLPADNLQKILNSLSADKVMVTQAEAGSVTLSAGRSKIKLPTMTAEDFPFELPVSDPYGTFKVSDAMLRGIEKCLVGVGQDPTHPAQMGITIESDGTLYSTDNFTISRYRIAGKIPLPGNSPVIMPTFFCQQLLALAKAFPDEPVEIDIRTESLVAVIGEQATLFTKLLVDVEPMNFSHIINRHLEGEDLSDLLMDIPDGFDSAFDRALLILSGDIDKATKLSVKDGRLKLYSSSQNGESSDTLILKVPDTEAIHVDPSLVSRSSKICRKIALLPKVMVMADGGFTHLIAHCSV